MELILNKTAYLQMLCNKYGDFRVCSSRKLPSGEVQFTTRKSVLDCWHSKKGLWFLSVANHREPFTCEIFLDKDEGDMDQWLKDTCDKLDKEQIRYYAYSTSSRGYHIHVIIPKLNSMSRVQREQYRERFITKYNAELLKKSDAHTVAIENYAHWKTGNIKTLIRRY